MEKIEAPLGKFKIATDALDTTGIDYVIFGGIAVWGYGRRRWTRDIDLLVRQIDAKSSLMALSKAGFTVEETDHRWIYKAKKNHASIDLIFRARGDIVLTPELLDRRHTAEIDGHSFFIMDPENLVLVKILATKEIRPADWYDAISILENQEDLFDWAYFSHRAMAHAEKVLSFLFFVRAFGSDGEGTELVPEPVLRDLVEIYARGQSSSKRRYA